MKIIHITSKYLIYRFTNVNQQYLKTFICIQTNDYQIEFLVFGWNT